VVERALADEGPLDRDQLRDRLAASGVPTQRQALVHLLMLASIRGLIVRGPIVAGKHAFVLVRDWLGKPTSVDRDRALAELARRYLAGHGPASDRDLARWAGLPLRDARVGLSAIASELDERKNDLVDLRRRSALAPLPAPLLLGSFEPVLLGWSSRQLLLAAKQPQLVSGGLFRPFALARGRAAGTWTMSGGAIAIDPFVRLSRLERAALDADAKDVIRFLGN
jgi:hypothetical protein